jgi:hypothetical protein
MNKIFIIDWEKWIGCDAFLDIFPEKYLQYPG